VATLADSAVFVTTDCTYGD